MTKIHRILAGALVLIGLGGIVFAQRGGGRGRGRGGGGFRGDVQMVDANNRYGVASWEVDQKFKNDLFTFVRIRYSSYGGGDRWAIDYPDGDLNLSFRLQQLTAIKVDPVPIVLELTDEKLFDYPFIYMLETGRLAFSDEEITALRRYLLNGGFLMVDDFWGEDEWDNTRAELKRVFPDKAPIDLPLEHPIFHCVFDLKEKPQIPSIPYAMRYRGTKITWEREDAKEVHYRGIFDDKGRMMIIICQNTDLGDGWEREGEDEYFFHEFSEKKAYPMGINIVFYAMTH